MQSDKPDIILANVKLRTRKCVTPTYLAVRNEKGLSEVLPRPDSKAPEVVRRVPGIIMERELLQVGEKAHA